MGFPFPLPTLLVTVGEAEPHVEAAFEGTLICRRDAFDTNSIMGHRFDNVIVAWADYAASDDSPLLEDTRRRLVDWVNTEIMPRTRAGRRPIWL